MDNCMYCEKGESLSAAMVLVCELPYSLVYLVRNQNYPGRCVVALKEHKRELFELTAAARGGFFDEVAGVAGVVSELFSPDKINYGIYGDGVPHLHCHVVPKRRDGFTWGAPFALQGNDHFLPDRELAERVSLLSERLHALYPSAERTS